MKPQKYTKRPVTIEAMQWDGTAAGATPIINWILANDGTATYQENRRMDGECIAPLAAVFRIHTLEGTMHAISGDYIIRGVKGEFYPCDPDIFHLTYDTPATTDTSKETPDE